MRTTAANAGYVLQPSDPKSSGDDLALLLVVRVGDTLKDFQATEGSLAAGGLVGDHATDDTEHHAGGRALVDGATLGVAVSALAQELSPFQLVPVHCKEQDVRERAKLGTDRGKSPQNVQEPEMFISSVRTRTTFCPFNSSLATTEAKRPSMCARQSTRTSFSNTICEVHGDGRAVKSNIREGVMKKYINERKRERAVGRQSSTATHNTRNTR